MKTNIGIADRVIRIVAGLLLLTSVFVFEGDVRWLGLVGVVLLLTALAGWCPAYSLLGIDSCRLNRHPARRT